MQPPRTPRRKTPVDHDPQALRWAREQAGWKQAPLARELGIPASLLCEAEKGTRNLRPRIKGQIANILGCPVSVFDRKAVAP